MGEEEKLVCHYTSIEGLAGIVRNKQIWATHPYYLNDTSELKSGLKFVFEDEFQNLNSKVMCQVTAQQLNRLRNEKGLSFRDYCLPVDAEEAINERVKVVLNELKKNMAESIFVASFCNQSGIDSNYHWLSYAPNGTGYCLIFEESYIRSLVFSNAEIDFGPVKYCDTYDDLLNEVAKEVSELINQLFYKSSIARRFDNNTMDEGAIEKDMFEMTKKVNRILAMYKPSQYKGELESRLLSMKFNTDKMNFVTASISSKPELPDIEFRISKSGTFIPYQPIPIDPKKIKKVVVRSDSHIDLKMKSCTMFLEKELGGDLPEVIKSSATLRTSL